MDCCVAVTWPYGHTRKLKLSTSCKRLWKQTCFPVYRSSNRRPCEEGAYRLPSLRVLGIMRPKRLIIAALALGLCGQAASAFQETTIGGGDQKAPAAPVLEMPKGPIDTTRGSTCREPN